jgi:thioredoxin 1
MSIGIEIHGNNFEAEVLKSPVPVLVDFWADWCGPCKAVGPILDKIAEDYAGKIKLCKINVDDEGVLAGQHGIVSIPTLIVYQNGEIAGKQVGAAPRPMIEALFTKLIAS